MRGFYDGNDDGSGDFVGLTEKLDYLQWLGVDCIWLLPMFPSPLRDGGYDIADFYGIHPDYGTVEDFESLHPGRPRARHPRHRRPGDEPHVERPPVVPGRAQRAGRLARARHVRVVRHRREVRRRAHHLHRHRDVELDLGPGRRPVLLAPLLLPPARPQLRQPGRPRADARRPALLAGPRARRLPPRRGALPLRARGHQLREPGGDARVPAQGARDGRRGVPRPRAARRGQPVARGRRRVLRQGRGRRVPHGLPLPGHAAHVHVLAPRGRDADGSRSWTARPRSRAPRSGACSCATTTS